MEDQNTEWKESWKDEYLKTLCEFANTDGGILTIGVDDHGKIVGVDNPEKLLKALPDKIRSRLGIIPFVRVDTVEPPYTVSILIQKAPASVTLDGKLYLRSGSTTQMVSGRELELHLIDHAGESWSDMPISGVGTQDLSPDAIQEFRSRGLKVGRLTEEEASMDAENLLDKMDLVRKGLLTRAAVILFHPEPGRIIGPCSVRMAMLDGPDILYMDELNGPMILVANRAVELLTTKYMIRPVSYDGIFRTESSPYPEPAIREAVMNAVIHNDYSSRVPIQIKVYPDHLTIYNEGPLPYGWTVETLMGQHKSILRNPGIAAVFFRAGLIESFGRGISKIMSQYEGKEEYAPVFESDASGFSVTFRNEIARRDVPHTEVSGPEKVVVDYLTENSEGTYAEIAEATGLGLRQIKRLSASLFEKGVVSKKRAGRQAVLYLSSSEKEV